MTASSLQPQPRTRRQPTRSCVACRARDEKRELIRLVRTPEGPVAVDTSGRAQGRGAYLGPRRACWEQALSSKQLGAALRTTLTDADRETLRSFANQLPGDPCPHLERDPS